MGLATVGRVDEGFKLAFRLKSASSTTFSLWARSKPPMLIRIRRVSRFSLAETMFTLWF
jgi:hypothetical protein